MSSLTLYPAIDLLSGRCVRLRQGDYQQVTTYGDDPVAVALGWQQAGAEWLHIVDLDGARGGQPAHLKLVADIAQATGLPIQLGGGLRSEEAVAAAFDAGVARVILGTAAARDPELLARCLDRWGERIAVSIDSRGGRVAIAGWRDSADEPPLVLARRMARAGVETLVVTNVERDGTLTGSDTGALNDYRAALPSSRIIAAGGLAALDDIRRLNSVGIDGAILGRALYEGAFELTEALQVASTANDQEVVSC